MNIISKPLSYSEVSAISRNEDHTTTIHLVRSVDELVEIGEIYNLIEEISDDTWFPCGDLLTAKAVAIQDGMVVVECCFEICQN